MNLETLSGIINSLLADLQNDENVKVDSFQKVTKENKLALRQAVGAELLQLTKESAFGAITPTVPPCHLIRQLLPTSTLTVLSNQGVVGKVLKGCLRKDCTRRPFAVKLVSFHGLSKNVKQLSLPQNYEVYVLNLLNRLLYTNQTPHIVLFYLSYICRCADYLPALEQTPPRLKLRSLFKAARERFAAVVRFRNTSDRFDCVLGSLQSIVQKTELLAQAACVWAAFLTNDCPTVVFPPVGTGNPWRFAKFQTMVTVALIFYPSIVQFQIELLAYYAYILPGTQSLASVCTSLQLPTIWAEHSRTIDSCVQQIVSSAQWSARVKELAAVSQLLPVITLPVKPKTAVPSRLYNFYVRTTLSEWVQGGSLRTVIQRNWFLLTEEDYAVLYFQYLYTMMVIQQQHPGFSHNDGHLDNILLAYKEVPPRWPLVRSSDRNRTQYMVTAFEAGAHFAVLMRPPNGTPIKFRAHGLGPFTVERQNTCAEYRWPGHRCYVPDVGYSVRLWDFDWSNINAAGTPQNQKVLTSGAQNRIFADAGQYYDIYLFFRQVVAMRDSTNSNAFTNGSCAMNYNLLFPSAIHQFHKRVLGPIECKAETYDNQRLSDTHVPGKYPTIASIIQTELRGGIFARFVDKKPCQTVYEVK